MELLYKSYSDMSIDDYFTMRAIVSDLSENEDDNTKIIFELLAFLCGEDVDSVYKNKLGETNKLINSIGWALQPIKQGSCPLLLKLGDWCCDVRLDLSKCTTEQFIDFSQYSKSRDKYYKECLACIIIPQGKRYNEGYDVNELVDIIGRSVSIQTAEDIYLSFAVASKILLNHSLKSLARKMKKNLRKTKKDGLTGKRVKEIRALIGVKKQIQLISGLDILT